MKAQSEVNRTASETSSIHLFAEHGNMDEVLRCLAEGVQVDKRDTRRQTALHCACSGGHADLVKFLIEKGADVEAKDGKLITPLHKAAMSGSPECVKLTLAGGAVVNARDDKVWHYLEQHRRHFSHPRLHFRAIPLCIGLV